MNVFLAVVVNFVGIACYVRPGQYVVWPAYLGAARFLAVIAALMSIGAALGVASVIVADVAGWRSGTVPAVQGLGAGLIGTAVVRFDSRGPSASSQSGRARSPGDRIVHLVVAVVEEVCKRNALKVVRTMTPDELVIRIGEVRQRATTAEQRRPRIDALVRDLFGNDPQKSGLARGQLNDFVAVAFVKTDTPPSW